MGREAICSCRVGAQQAEVKALLESTELILRGAIKRRYALGSLKAISVLGGELHFTAGDEPVALLLGDSESQRWAAKIATPPKSLADKLGLNAAQPAYVWGDASDPALAEALRGAQTRSRSAAKVLVAVLRSEAELAEMIVLHQQMACAAVWVVHPKGPAASLGDTTIRQSLREQGYVDNKTSAVSPELTATRYVKR
jgi:hypothetical protein